MKALLNSWFSKWKLHRNLVSLPCQVHSGAVRSVCFSWDDSILLTASDDKTIKLPGHSMQRIRTKIVCFEYICKLQELQDSHERYVEKYVKNNM